jgi:hypothetical protein
MVASRTFTIDDDQVELILGLFSRDLPAGKPFDVMLRVWSIDSCNFMFQRCGCVCLRSRAGCSKTWKPGN